MQQADTNPCMRPRPGPILLRCPDPGWLFLIAGLAMIASAVLIPASEALKEARYARDRTLVTEAHRIARLDKHRAYLEALDERQPALIAQLKAIQLNQYPEGMRPLGELDLDPGRASASVFGMLEPPLPEMPAEPRHRAERSMLADLATGDPSRLWVIAGGGLCVLLGVLPPSRARRRVPKRARSSRRASATVPA